MFEEIVNNKRNEESGQKVPEASPTEPGPPASPITPAETPAAVQSSQENGVSPAEAKSHVEKEIEDVVEQQSIVNKISPKEKGKGSGIWMIVIIVVLLVMAGVVYFFMPKIKSLVLGDENFNGKLACPTDTQECDDGSTVKRIGPDCKFEKCPEAPHLEECVKEGELVTTMTLEGENIIYECCDELSSAQTYSISMDECIGVEDVAVCIDCPNGDCGPGENKCNCPQDCRDLDPSLWPVETLDVWEVSYKIPPNYALKNIEDLSKSVTRQYRDIEDECYSNLEQCEYPYPAFSVSSRIVDTDDLMTFAMNDEDYSAENVSTTSIAGYDFIKLEHRGAYGYDTYFLKNENRIFEFVFHTLPKEDIDIVLKSISILPPMEEDWVNFSSNTYGFQFRHPREWSFNDMKSRIDFSDTYGSRTITVSVNDITTSSISYCAANLNDSNRCELVMIGDRRGIIDWQGAGKPNAELDLNATLGLSVTLEDDDENNVVIFRKILETFDFSKVAEDAVLDPEDGVGDDNAMNEDTAQADNTETEMPVIMEPVEDDAGIIYRDEVNGVSMELGNGDIGVEFADGKYVILSKGTVTDDYFEVFTKDPSDTLSSAVMKRFLAGIDSEICSPEIKTDVYGLPSTYVFTTAIMHNSGSEAGSDIATGTDDICPADYSTNDLNRFFMADLMSFDRYVFIQTGSAPVYSHDTTPWYATLKFVDPTKTTNSEMPDENESSQDVAEDNTMDSDGDGLSDSDEILYGTDINNPDTDGDGYLDGEEVAGGYNPNGEGKLE